MNVTAPEKATGPVNVPPGMSPAAIVAGMPPAPLNVAAAVPSAAAVPVAGMPPAPLNVAAAVAAAVALLRSSSAARRIERTRLNVARSLAADVAKRCR